MRGDGGTETLKIFTFKSKHFEILIISFDPRLV